MKNNTKKFLTLALSAAMLSAVGVGAAVSAPEKVNADTVTFATVGAQVRSEGVAGMRFVNVVNEKVDGATYGTLIIPENVLAGAELTVNTEKVLNIEAAVWNDALAEKAGYEGYKAYTGVVVGSTLEAAFPASEYGRSFVARGYVTTADGTTYTAPIVRSMAGVANDALGNPDDTDTALLTDIVDSVAEGFSIKESALTLDLGAVETLTLAGANGLTPAYTVSDDTTVWVSENGEVQGLKNGTATVTATIGSYTDTVSVTVESAGSSLGTAGSIANGIVKLHGVTRTALPYIALPNCASGDAIEVEFTGKNTPVIHFMAESVHGNFKETTNTGFLVDNSAGVFRIYPRYSEAGSAGVLDPTYANKSLDASTTYVLRASLMKNTAGAYIVYAAFYTKAVDGSLTLLTTAKSATTEAGITETNAHYILLYGNAHGTGTTSFTYRRYTNAFVGTAAAFENTFDGTAFTLNAGSDRGNLSYLAYDFEFGQAFEVVWTGKAMPNFRVGATTINSSTKVDNGGYLFHNINGGTMRYGSYFDSSDNVKYADTPTDDTATKYKIFVQTFEENGVKSLNFVYSTLTDGAWTEIASKKGVTGLFDTADEYYLVFYASIYGGGVYTYQMTYVDVPVQVENVQLNEETGVVSFAKSAVDTTYQISVNGGEWVDVTSTGYTASYTIADFAEGTYTVVVRSSDGNELTTKTFTVATETPAPVES